MPTLSEQIEQASKQLSVMEKTEAKSLGTGKIVELSPAQAVAAIQKQLASGNLTDDQSSALIKILGEVSKQGFEQATVTKIPVFHDAWQTDPEPPKTMPAGGAKADSSFAMNSTLLAKKADILKENISKAFVALEKATATEKLDAIMTMFGLDAEDMKSSYDCSYKVGDMIRLLYQLSKIESMGVELSGSAMAGGEQKASQSKAASEEPVEWPADLASAKFDVEKGSYSRAGSVWDRG